MISDLSSPIDIQQLKKAKTEKNWLGWENAICGVNKGKRLPLRFDNSVFSGAEYLPSL